VIIDPIKNPRMCGTTRRFPYKYGAFQHLQVVAELLGDRKNPG
jgi:hypothetical protein